MAFVVRLFSLNLKCTIVELLLQPFAAAYAAAAGSLPANPQDPAPGDIGISGQGTNPAGKKNIIRKYHGLALVHANLLQSFFIRADLYHAVALVKISGFWFLIPVH